MAPIYLFGLLVLLSTEYGFQSRGAAISRWAGGWRWGRTLLRALAMALGGVGLWVLRIDTAPWYAAVGIVWAELGAWLLRAWIRADLSRGQRHGAPLTHLFCLAYPVALGGAVWAMDSVTHASLLLRPAERITLAMAGAAALVALWAWATLMVVSIVGVVRPEQVRDMIAPRVGAGEIIGILERYVTFVLVLAGGMAAVGFVVAAKAAARFPQFDREEFAEYFLVGTLSSVGLSVISGLAVRGLYLWVR
jgi:hypothetical protein